jgi:hypothetical protein
VQSKRQPRAQIFERFGASDYKHLNKNQLWIQKTVDFFFALKYCPRAFWQRLIPELSVPCILAAT